ncbi:hypothetical protein ACAW74_13560 [Fibrella sp. WM1]|uniref:hypothetical protein n=1 Tax=Fibrella musci TaxID=3242485 RepID=UPI00352154C5
MFILYAKLVASLLLAVILVLVLWQRQRIESELARPNIPWLPVFWLVLRLVPFLVIYVSQGFSPQSDVRGYYYPIAKAAAYGKMLYRDVICPYSPLFGYWLAPFVWLWRDPKVIVLAMTLFELLAVWLTYRELLSPEKRPARLFRCLMYYLLPVSFVFCVTSGQEDVVLWIFALLAGKALANNQSFRAGLWFALGLLSTKALFVLMGVPLFFMARKKMQFVGACALLGLPVALFYFWKADLLFIQQPLEEGAYLKAPNLRSVLAPFIGEAINRFQNVESYVGLLTTVGLTGYVLYRRHQLGQLQTDARHTVALFYILIFSWTTVVQHNAISNYAYLTMLPLLFVMVDLTNGRVMGALIVFNVLAAVHSSFWWRIGQPFFYSFRQIDRPTYLLDYGIEIFLVSGFTLFAIQAVKQLVVGQAAPTSIQRHVPEH